MGDFYIEILQLNREPRCDIINKISPGQKIKPLSDMSNKTLIIIIVILLVIFGGSILFYRSLNSTVKGQDTAQTPAGSLPLAASDQSQVVPVQDASTTPATASSTPPATPTTQGQTMNDCTRNFSQSKLDQNANINIKNRQVTINVKNFGDITVQLYDQDAPKTVENFLRLTDSGYYDCLTFHRVSKNFVIQGGDPSGNGSGGTSAFGAPFADELNPNTASFKAGYEKGVLAMANSGPNTNGSQFFIMLADTPLPHNYTIFGKVVSGQDVVDKIGQVDITPNPQMGPTDGAPVTPVVMESVKITK